MWCVLSPAEATVCPALHKSDSLATGAFLTWPGRQSLQASDPGHLSQSRGRQRAPKGGVRTLFAPTPLSLALFLVTEAPVFQVSGTEVLRDEGPCSCLVPFPGIRVGGMHGIQFLPVRVRHGCWELRERFCC